MGLFFTRVCSFSGQTEQGIAGALQPEPWSQPLRAVLGNSPAQSLDMGPSPTTAGSCLGQSLGKDTLDVYSLFLWQLLLFLFFFKYKNG